MSAAPLTSVVIPACCAAGTIARTLASLTAQTRRDWEAIVVDDGSTDGTSEIVAGHARADPRVRLIAQGNAGAAAARNRGLAAARGEWTLFLDADDRLHRHHLAAMHRRLARDPAAEAVCCGFVRVAPGGAVLARYPAPRLDRDAAGICARRPPTAIHAMLCRTDLLRRLGGFEPALRTNEDWDLWWRMAQAGTRFAVEPQALAEYHATAASLTRDGPAMLRDTIAMLGRIAGAGAPDGQALVEALLWNAGSMIGGGGDAPALLAQMPRCAPPADMDGAIGAFVEGLMIGAMRPLPALAALYPADQAGTVLARIGDHVGDAAWAAGLARGIERALIRTARFAGTLRVGASLGLMLSPRMLAGDVAGGDGIERIVVRVPLLRPRSRWMVDLPGTGASGARIVRRLARGR